MTSYKAIAESKAIADIAVIRAFVEEKAISDIEVINDRSGERRTKGLANPSPSPGQSSHQRRSYQVLRKVQLFTKIKVCLFIVK